MVDAADFTSQGLIRDLIQENDLLSRVDRKLWQEAPPNKTPALLFELKLVLEGGLYEG